MSQRGAMGIPCKITQFIKLYKQATNQQQKKHTVTLKMNMLEHKMKKKQKTQTLSKQDVLKQLIKFKKRIQKHELLFTRERKEATCSMHCSTTFLA